MKSILFSRTGIFLFALQCTILIGTFSCNKKNAENPQPIIDSIKQVHQNDEEEEEDTLPEHYVMANLDGIHTWISDTCHFTYNTAEKPDTLLLTLWSVSDTVYLALSISVPLANLSDQCVPETEYPFIPPPKHINNINYGRIDPITGAHSMTIYAQKGRTVITKCNFADRTLLGTFEYSLLPDGGDEGDSIRIKNGQFRIPLNKHWNWFE